MIVRVALCLALSLVALSDDAPAQAVRLLVDATGDGGVDGLDRPEGMFVDTDRTVYIAGHDSDNVLKIELDGTITQIIGPEGDGTNSIEVPYEPAVAPSGNVYVNGWGTDNAFRIEPDGTITQILDASGDGLGNTVDRPRGIALDASENLFVCGQGTHNVFKIEPNGTVTQILDASGDGLGNTLTSPWDLCVDDSGNVYVTGLATNNVFKVTPSGVITQLMDASGDGMGNTLCQPWDVAVGADGIVYVAGGETNNAFRILTDGTVEEILDASGDGTNGFAEARQIEVDADNNVYVSGAISNNVFCISPGAPGGTITEVIDTTGDGMGNSLLACWHMDIDDLGGVYAGGALSDNAFHVSAWEDLGGGTSGVAGDTYLVAAGSLKAGSPFELDLFRGAPSSLSALFISISSTPTPFLGGTLHAFPFEPLVFLPTDADGEIHAASHFPAAPSGFQVWFQFAVGDGSVPWGATLSNGVVGTVP